MGKIIALTGYKGVGKSTLASEIQKELLSRNIRSEIISYATPLKDLARLITEEYIHNDGLFDSDKKEELLLNGKTPRDFIVDLSEKLMKPYFGDDIWIQDLENRIYYLQKKADIIIIDDLRFNTEAEALKKYDCDIFKISGKSEYQGVDFEIDDEHINEIIISDKDNNKFIGLDHLIDDIID